MTFVPTPPPEPPPAPNGAVAKPIVPMNVLPPATELPPNTLRVLVLGDSVALSLGARMRYAQDSADAFVAHRAVGDCSILDGVVPVHSMGGEPHGNGNCASSWVDDAKELAPDVVAIVLGGAYFSKVKGDGRWRAVCDRLWHDPYAHHLADVLRQLAPFTKRRVLVYAAYPVGHWQTPTLDDKVDCYNRILRDAADEAGAEILDLNGWLCPDRKCTVTSRDAPVRPDGLHFDGLGAEDTAQWVLGQIRAGSTRDH
jgi:lysophospholipase L1-like esterase